MPKFSVDTHLFRELGELLVGRDSTALVELIKNSYDADATTVVIYGEHLDDPAIGKIMISDNGIGMDHEQFVNGFLRIASRFKDEGVGRSARYQRRFTGAKGIGRLAAHKLARSIQLFSVAWSPHGFPVSPIRATIDWDAVESVSTLDELEDSNAITITDDPATTSSHSGTVISLVRLRKRWTPAERTRFFAEVTSFTPPRAITEPPTGIAVEDLLFEKPKVCDHHSSKSEFNVELQGELEAGDDYWQALANIASWIVEIDARKDIIDGSGKSGQVRYNIVPTKRFKTAYPDAEKRIFEWDHPNAEEGPFFQARILVREPSVANGEIPPAWLGRSHGIRVFMEGFRVLPYGEPNNDWLEIDSEYAGRAKQLTWLKDVPAGIAVGREEGLTRLRNNNYFGAVFLTVEGTPSLKMLINREGFVPDSGYENLVRLIRIGVDLSTRVRAQATQQKRTERSETRRERVVEEGRRELRDQVASSVQRASEFAAEARKQAAVGNFQQATNYISRAAEEFSLASETSERLITEGAILRILASVGMQMTAFVHEINALLGTAIAVEGTFQSLRADDRLSQDLRLRLAQVQTSVSDLRRAIERQASYLVDVVAPDARRRRSRQKLAERFNAARRLVEPAAARKAITITNEIPEDLKTPAMFPAEIMVVFANLLTNAVKAAGDCGRIRAYANEVDSTVICVIENTGTSVDFAEGERWFKPFESTTVETDPVLGQGMGMGLPITRNILAEYGARIRFVQPSGEYATAIEITFG